MEIIIHQAILHVLDTTLDAPVLSGNSMELTAEKTAYLQNHGVLLYRAAQMERPCHLARGQAVGLFRPECVKGGQVSLEHDSRLALR